MDTCFLALAQVGVGARPGSSRPGRGQLPPSLRGPLLEGMKGHPLRAIAEDFGYSESTAHRRINEAREHLRDYLAPSADARPWVPFDTGIDPVLERAQRRFEEAFQPPPGVEPGRGPAR